jgi:hypothetical protein
MGFFFPVQSPPSSSSGSEKYFSEKGKHPGLPLGGNPADAVEVALHLIDHVPARRRVVTGQQPGLAERLYVASIGRRPKRTLAPDLHGSL